jgi:hypothetical protein
VSADLVWPEENEIDLSLALLVKILAMSINPNTLPLDGIYYPDNDQLIRMVTEVILKWV